MSRVHSIPSAYNAPADPPAAWTPAQNLANAQGRLETAKMAYNRAATPELAKLARLEVQKAERKVHKLELEVAAAERQHRIDEMDAEIAAKAVANAAPPVSVWGPEFDGPRVPAGKAVTVVVAAPVAAAPVIDAPTNTNHRLRIAAETPAPITLANAAEIVTFVPDADGKSVLVTRILNSYPWGRKRLTMTLADGRIEYKRLKLAGFKPW